MKNQKINALLKTTTLKVGSMVMAAALLIGGSTLYNSYRNTAPELVSFVDSEGTVSIDEDEVPLGTAKVTTSTKTSKKTKKIKMKTASKKTYTKKGKTKTKTTTKKSKSSTEETTTKTVVKTTVTNSYKKGSKVNTQVTTTKTTTTKTVVPIASTAAKTVTASAGSATGTSTVEITQIAPKADSRVLNAYQKLGFTVTINPNVTYSGLCDARTRSITLKKADDTVYHELGHFVAFVAGNMDTSAEFQAIYNQEKSAYTEYNKSYVLANSSEYFAESFKNYTLNPSALKASRPQTYTAIESALGKITDAQLTKLLAVYGAIWK